MPVGRITFFHLEPMTFFEFLIATGNEALYNRTLSVAPGRPLPQPLHEKGIKLYQEFCLVGGMPEPLIFYRLCFLAIILGNKATQPFRIRHFAHPVV
jgi:predicted AAA+ superfamily ATPase